MTNGNSTYIISKLRKPSQISTGLSMKSLTPTDDSWYCERMPDEPYTDMSIAVEM